MPFYFTLFLFEFINQIFIIILIPQNSNSVFPIDSFVVFYLNLIFHLNTSLYFHTPLLTRSEITSKLFNFVIDMTNKYKLTTQQ